MLGSFCSHVLIILGVHPQHPLGKLRVGGYTMALFFLYTFGLINVYENQDVDTVESLVLMIIMQTSYLIFVLGRKTMKRLLTTTECFWEMNMEDEETNYMAQYLRRAEKLFRFISIMGVTSFFVKPFLLHETSIFKLYRPQQIPLFIFFLFEFYILTSIGLSYVCFATFICSLIVWIAEQFRTLNLYVKSIDFMDSEVDVCTRKIKCAIKYHQLLIRYVDDLNSLLSVPLAIMIIFGVGMMCLEMYVITKNNEHMIVLCKALIICLGMMAQYSSVYGIPAQLLMNQSTAMADVIYCDLEWYLPDIVPVRKYLVMMILRSQKAVCIRAGGYHVVNNQTVLIMLKTAYSFYTFLQALS